MGEFFTVKDQRFEFGRTVGDAKRLLKQTSPKSLVHISVRCDDGGGWGASSMALHFSKTAFLRSLGRSDDQALISHIHTLDDGHTFLLVSSPLAIQAAMAARAAASPALPEQDSQSIGAAP